MFHRTSSCKGKERCKDSMNPAHITETRKPEIMVIKTLQTLTKKSRRHNFTMRSFSCFSAEMPTAHTDTAASIS